MKPVIYLLLSTCGMFPFLQAQTAQPSAPPAPATEMKSMAFLIGQWQLDAWFPQADGSKRKSKATMEAKYTLDGKGIEMTARYPGAAGKPDFVSVHTFVFNPRLGKIIGSGINTLGNWKSFEATAEDGKLIIIQSGMLFQGRSGINRRTLFDIGKDSFKAVLDHSPDDGKTWQKATFGYTATRIQ